MLLYPFWLFMMILSSFDRLSIILLVLMMIEFTKEIIARLKMFTMKMGKRVEKCLKYKSFKVKFDT